MNANVCLSSFVNATEPASPTSKNDAEVEVVGRRPFGGPIVVRIGSAAEPREFDFAEEVASALWVHSDAAHAGCSVTGP